MTEERTISREERVARAICCARELDADEIGRLTDKPRWTLYVVEARAAIAALSLDESLIEALETIATAAVFRTRTDDARVCMADRTRDVAREALSTTKAERP